jgi:hypothetical protein
VSAAVPLEVLFTEIGPFLLAVDARRVREVGDHETAAVDGGARPLIDLAERLGEAAFPGVRPRRVLELGTSHGTVAVVAGEDVWTGTLAVQQLQEVPGLVAAPLGLAGIRHVLVPEDEGLIYVLDPEALR